MKGRSAAKMIFLFAYFSTFVGYLAPKLNEFILSPALPDQLKYTLDFVLFASTSVVIYFGMSARTRTNERALQEATDLARADERKKALAEIALRPPRVPAVLENENTGRSPLEGETIEVSFAGVGDVNLSHIRNIRKVKVELPKTELSEEKEPEVKDEIAELLEAQPSQ